MRFKKKLKISILPLLVLILLPSIYALTITDTTFYSSVSNYTIHVDSIVLDNVTVTNLTIEFYNLSSVGSNFTNVNATYDARADFYGLDVGLTIRNVNTGTNLFTSALGSQNYNASFTPGQVLRILSEAEVAAQIHPVANQFRIGLAVFATFFGLVILALIGKTVLDLFQRKEVNIYNLVKSLMSLILVAVIILVGIAVISAIGAILV